ncbi:hypothetical protein C4573_03130 [Candidatus Woesearchaeota archaeon]|nr:MAG: hypothetical protein C4573_03130 [Candidatus Woesearchaeota archaeon]
MKTILFIDTADTDFFLHQLEHHARRIHPRTRVVVKPKGSIDLVVLGLHPVMAETPKGLVFEGSDICIPYVDYKIPLLLHTNEVPPLQLNGEKPVLDMYFIPYAQLKKSPEDARNAFNAVLTGVLVYGNPFSDLSEHFQNNNFGYKVQSQRFIALEDRTGVKTVERQLI